MWVFEFLLFLLSINYTSAIECICPGGKSTQADYYWRDYLGAIPKDAVDGGYSESGDKTYVGQMASYEQPVNITPGMLRGTGSTDVKTHEDTYVKILCSGRNTEFEWKSTSADELHLLTDYHLVDGGNFMGQVQIGRVFTKDIQNVKGLWLFNKDGAQVNFQTFELLVLPRK